MPIALICYTIMGICGLLSIIGLFGYLFNNDEEDNKIGKAFLIGTISIGCIGCLSGIIGVICAIFGW